MACGRGRLGRAGTTHTGQAVIPGSTGDEVEVNYGIVSVQRLMTPRLHDFYRPFLLSQDSTSLMPKHVPTFKHLIATSSSREQDRKQRDRTVNELLQASREQQRNIRDAPPHLRSARGQGPWSSATPSVAELASGEAEIHP